MDLRRIFDFSGENRATVLAGAVGAWVLLALTAFAVMPQTIRFLALALLTAGVLVATVYELTQKAAGRRLIPLFALIWAVGAGTLLAAIRFAPPDELPDGPLVAGSGAALHTPCGAAPSGDLVMIFGNDAVIGHGNGPFMPVRVGTCPALTFTRGKAGLMVNAFGFDSDGNVVYRIRDNHFEQVLGGFLRGHRPNLQTLRVSDERDIEALRIRYISKDAVQVWGTFRCGDTHPVRVGDGFVGAGGKSVGMGRCVRLQPGAAYGIEYSDQAAAQ